MGDTAVETKIMVAISYFIGIVIFEFTETDGTQCLRLHIDIYYD